MKSINEKYEEIRKILRILLDNYKSMPQALESLKQDILDGSFLKRHDFIITRSNFRQSSHRGRTGAPIKNASKRPQTKIYTISKNPGLNEPEIIMPCRIGGREIERQANFKARPKIDQLPGWNRMKPIQRVNTILELQLDHDTKTELIASVLEDEGKF